MSGNALQRTRFPFLGSEVRAGSYAPHDGHANPRLAAPAFGRAAARAGARVFENTEIVRVEKDGEDFRVDEPRWTGVPCSRGTHHRRSLGQPAVDASSASRCHSSVHGPQMSVTEPVPYAIEPVLGVATDVLKEVVYMRQVKRGNIVIGGSGRGLASIETNRATVLPQNTLSQLANRSRGSCRR